MVRFRQGRYKGKKLRPLDRKSVTKIKKLLQNKLGEYTEEDFEKFLERYQPKDQVKIRKIETELKGG